MFFPLSTIKKFHVEIVFVAWLRDLSWEVKIFFFFSRRHFWKVLNPSVILFACLLTANIICICYYFLLIVVAFPACTCEPVHIQHSFEFLCMLPGLGWVGLAQKISARCNTGSYVFSFFFICIFILLLALSHIYVFLFPQRVPSDLEVGYEKSILTRT